MEENHTPGDDVAGKAHDESNEHEGGNDSDKKEVDDCEQVPLDSPKKLDGSQVFVESPKGDGEKIDYGTSLLQDSIFYDKEIQVRPELIDSLTEGFTEKFLPSLEKNKKTISQIKSSQAVLIETVQQENAKFSECQAMEGLEKMLSRAKVYHVKLLRLRKDMTALHEKSAKLKRRALRLQQQKQKEELTRAQQMETEYEKEKMLTARVASPSSDQG